MGVYPSGFHVRGLPWSQLPAAELRIEVSAQAQEGGEGNVLSLQWSEGSELPDQPFSTGQDKMHTHQVAFSEFRPDVFP